MMQKRYTTRKQLLRWEDWVGDKNTSRGILLVSTPRQEPKGLQLERSGDYIGKDQDGVSTGYILPP